MSEDGSPVQPDTRMEAGEAPGSPLRTWYDDHSTAANEMVTDAEPQPIVTDDADTVFGSLSDEERGMVASILKGIDVTEIYSPARVNQLALKFGLAPGHSLDLTNGWNFAEPEARERAWKLIKQSKPYVVIGSPPCTMFSRLQELNCHMHREDPNWLQEFEWLKARAVKHIECCVEIYEYQLQHGRHFIHEHPWTAKSWNLDCVQTLM